MLIELFDDSRMGLGESPLWSVAEQALYWIDVYAGTIHRKVLETGRRSTWEFGEEVGSIGFRAAGGLVVAARTGLYAFDLQTGEKTLVSNPEPELPRNRLNDGKVDRQGRYWSGSLQTGEYAPVGSLWSFKKGRSTKIISGITIANGLCFSPDGRTMYFTDSPSGMLEAFDLDIATGLASNRRVLAAIPDGRGLADGATVDADGTLWCANIDGGRILGLKPEEGWFASVDLPVTRPTSCAFGGPSMDILFVTTATSRLGEEQLLEQPWAGCVLAIKGLGATGLQEPEYQ
ncbi:SMP-30/gluconolactonase/LRE family protein [Pusillimonas noertemannii]|uniref:SMP-30/gluconolactonase/LRE family protein n=1 Tax=Pusillimonas noertemannii TaxID=305977 RepID=UPI000317ABC8|nr:SMP-30/gluconolactonase/LRE family protein [Pusillimonas noertemannii]